MKKTDRGLVFLEMDLYWTVAGGADPIEYLQKYPNRQMMMPVKNMKKVRFSGSGSDPAQWIEFIPLHGNGL